MITAIPSTAVHASGKQYLTDGAKPIEFEIKENGKIIDLTDEQHSVYNQIKHGDIESVKIGAGIHKRLADVPFRITSKTTGESHIVVIYKNGQFYTASDWASHKHNTNAGRPQRTVSGSAQVSQTTAKVYYFMILMGLRNYAVKVTKASSSYQLLTLWCQETD